MKRIPNLETTVSLIRWRLGWSGFLAATLLLFASCQTQTVPLPNPATATTPVTLAPGDVIRLTFTDEPDLNLTQKVRRDGKVSLPLLGEVTGRREEDH